MSRSTAVEKVESGNVPELASTPATEVTFEDIAPPTLTIAQRTSGLVDNNLATYGDLVVAQGRDDTEPIVLSHVGPDADGVVFYPLHMYKTWTHSDGKNLTSWPFGDGTPPEEAEALAQETGKPFYRTYNYVLFVPEFDDQMPVIFRLNSKSQAPAANKINFTVSRGSGVWHEYAFRVTTDKRENGSNRWAVPVLTTVEAKPEQVAKAAELRALILPGIVARQQRAEQAAANLPGV
jgi:hypothetical protein